MHALTLHRMLSSVDYDRSRVFFYVCANIHLEAEEKKKLEERPLGTEKRLIRIADTLEKIVEKLDKIEKAIFSIG